MARPAGTRKHRPVEEAWAFVPLSTHALLVARHPTRPDFRLLEAHLLHAKVEPVYMGGIDPATSFRPFCEVPAETANACRGLKPKESGTLAWLGDYAATTGATVREIYRFADDDMGSGARRVSVDHLALCRQELTKMRAARAEKIQVATTMPPAPFAAPPRTLNEDQALIADYFTRLFAAYEWTQYRPACDDTTLQVAFDALSSGGVDISGPVLNCCCFPPRYASSKDGTTCRVFDRPNWQQVPRAFVSAAFPDWRDLDLARCYTAVITLLAGAVGAYEPAARLGQLLDASNFWEAAALGLGAPSGTPKQAVKKFVQSRQFGATRQTAANEAQANGASFGAVQAMVKSPLFADLGTVYAALRAAIRADGLRDAYGEVCKVGTRGMRKESAILHWVCSTYELRLIARVYDVANQREDGRVMRHMHDGVDVRGKPAFVEAIQSAVAVEASALGVRTSLLEKHTSGGPA